MSVNGADLITGYLCGNHQAHGQVLYCVNESVDHYVLSGMERLILSKILGYNDRGNTHRSDEWVSRVKYEVSRLHYKRVRNRCWIVEQEELGEIGYNGYDGYLLWNPRMIESCSWGIKELEDTIRYDLRIIENVIFHNYKVLRYIAYEQWGWI